MRSRRSVGARFIIVVLAVWAGLQFSKRQRTAPVAPPSTTAARVEYGGKWIDGQAMIVAPNELGRRQVHVLIGRDIVPGDVTGPATNVAVLSNAMWKAFGAPVEIIGNTAVINGVKRIVVGVTVPEAANVLPGVGVFLPGVPAAGR